MCSVMFSYCKSGSKVPQIPGEFISRKVILRVVFHTLVPFTERKKMTEIERATLHKFVKKCYQGMALLDGYATGKEICSRSTMHLQSYKQEKMKMKKYYKDLKVLQRPKRALLWARKAVFLKNQQNNSNIIQYVLIVMNFLKALYDKSLTEHIPLTQCACSLF